MQCNTKSNLYTYLHCLLTRIAKHNFFSYLFVVILGFTITACTDFLHGHKKEEKSKILEVKNEKLDQCLKDLSTSFENVNSKDIDCIKDALDSFAKNTKGDEDGYYAEEELLDFYNKLLKTSKKMDLLTLRAILKLKVFIVGGDSNKLTRIEIEKFKAFLDELSRQLPKIQDKYKVFFFSENSEKVSFSQIQLAVGAFREASAELLKLTQSKDSKLEFQDWKNILFILSSFYEGESFSSAVKWFPLIERAKVLLLGDESKFFARTDMKVNFDWLFQSYGVFLQYYYKIKHLEYQNVTDWEELIAWLDQIFELLPQAPILKDKSAMSLVELDRSLEEVWKLELFKSELSLDLYKSTYRKFINKFLEAGKVASGDLLKKDHLDVLYQEYQIWRTSQRSINYIFANKQQATIAFEDFKKELSIINVPAMMKVSSQVLTASQKNFFQRSYLDFVQLFFVNRPMIFNENYQLMVSANNPETISFTASNLSNALRSLMRLIMMGYGNNADLNNLTNNKISEASFIKFEEDFRAFGRALGLLDPRQTNSAIRTFREANLFTMSGNGDSWLSFQELYEGFSLLMSGGRFTVNRVYTELLPTSKVDGPPDIFGKSMIQKKAFQDTLFATESARMNYYDNIGNLKKFLLTLNTNEQQEFFNNLMSIAQINTDTGSTETSAIEYAEMRTAITVLQYLESLLIIYDLDHDEKLSVNEVMAALPRFINFLKTLPGAAGNDDRDLEDVFLYLVFKGKKIDGPNFWSSWKGFNSRADFTLFRNQLMLQPMFPSLIPPVGRKELMQALVLLK